MSNQSDKQQQAIADAQAALQTCTPDLMKRWIEQASWGLLIPVIVAQTVQTEATSNLLPQLAAYSQGLIAVASERAYKRGRADILAELSKTRGGIS